MNRILLSISLSFFALLNIKAQDQAASRIGAGQLAQKFSYSADLLLSQQLRRYNPDLFKLNESGNYVLNYKLIKGSPYENNQYQPGKIIDEKYHKSTNMFLRYNIYGDEIEIKKSLNSKAKALLKKHDISCVIKGIPYKFLTFKNSANREIDGYLKLLYKGTKYSLYERLTSRFTPKQEAENSFTQATQAFFDTSISYYIEHNGSITFFPNKKKYLIKKYLTLSKGIKSYIKKHHTRLKEKNDMIGLVIFLNKTN